jgi:hypothetical protein
VDIALFYSCPNDSALQRGRVIAARMGEGRMRRGKEMTGGWLVILWECVCMYIYIYCGIGERCAREGVGVWGERVFGRKNEI